MTKIKTFYRFTAGLLVALIIFNLTLLPVFAASSASEEAGATAETTTTTADDTAAGTDTTETEEEASSATTDSGSGSSGFQFMVSPVLPDNQRGTTLGYFDLTVKPDTTQNLQLIISNSSDEKKVFSVGAVSASTTPSGVVDYVTPGVKDETLKYPFADMAKAEEEQLTIDAQSEREINIVLTTPKATFDGMVLGGLRITDITDRLKREQQEEKPGEGLSMSLYNEYEAIVAVVLRETEKEIAPNFELGEVYAGSDNYRASIISEIRNTEPILTKKLLFSASIKPDRSDTEIFSIKETEVSFAPNSVMAYTFKDELGVGIEPGTYHYTASLTDGDQVWDFSKTFTIEKEVAQEVNEEAGNQQQIVAPITSITIIIVVAALAVLVIILIILLVKRKRS